MSQVQIDVVGSASVQEPPQRGTVHVNVGFDGADPQSVAATLQRQLDLLQATVQQLHDPDHGPVTRYVVEQVRTSAHRPWNESGEQLPLVYTAAAGLSARFSDFGELGRWIAVHAGDSGLSIGGIDWSLTKQRRAELERGVRQDAVRDAAVRAQDYADALNLGQVTVCAIADPGAEPVLPRPMMATMAGRAAAADEGFDLTPEPIEVGAHVRATFVTNQ